MEKSKLDNLINFAFLFHVQMDNKWEDLDTSYILEKWNKIIGTEPDKNLNVHEDYVIDNWRRKWSVKDDEYQRVKHIINFIRLVNLKPIYSRIDSDDGGLAGNFKNWRPDDLVRIYENNIGDPNLISKGSYNHIHELLRRAIESYKKRYLREYNLTLLI